MAGRSIIHKSWSTCSSKPYHAVEIRAPAYAYGVHVPAGFHAIDIAGNTVKFDYPNGQILLSLADNKKYFTTRNKGRYRHHEILNLLFTERRKKLGPAKDKYDNLFEKNERQLISHIDRLRMKLLPNKKHVRHYNKPNSWGRLYGWTARIEKDEWHTFAILYDTRIPYILEIRIRGLAQDCAQKLFARIFSVK